MDQTVNIPTTGGVTEDAEFKRFSQQRALEFLPELEKLFAAGDKYALMQAISQCALYDLVLPRWAAEAFLEGYYSVLNLRSASWDEAFGRPYKKGFHLDKAKVRRSARLEVFLAVGRIRAREPNTPIDDHLFERVGQECNVGRSLANQLYYEHKRYADSLLPPDS
ncbi:hypothetical protein [Mesorhizobium loti]|uniref:Uncharacterized protein n=1 Tax=Mesorhizobium loti R88b TaxID=935548 RepID=A0A6M7WRI2_RHILI|nr:hypothetical protein [Mesorhizobium loti]QKD03463.1 hypothetical protein EB235_19765 [Mesorhizobium loti R88b]